MPAPQGSMLQQLSKVNFVAKQIKLPTEWQDPGDQYADAFDPGELSVPPNSPVNLFREATLNKSHVDTAKEIGSAFEAYIDGICSAICDGIGNWMKATGMTGVIVNAVTGIIPPGAVQGPPLGPLILAGAPMNTPQEIKYSNAIANAFGTLWQAWHLSICGPLGPAPYPAFAAFPGPLAPPIPNVPIPLIALSAPGESGLAPDSLKGLMVANLADPTALHHVELFESIAKAFNPVFMIFKSTTMVQNVLGTGPVPTFAPPFVPVGPVVMGTGNAAPGTLLV